MDINRVPGTNNFNISLNRLFIVKILELVLTCTCVILDRYSYIVYASVGILVSGTFVGYLIIFVGVTAGQVMKTPVHKNIDMFYSLLGMGLFIASGACIINKELEMDYETAYMPPMDKLVLDVVVGGFRRRNLAKASLAIINGAVLLIDAVLTKRGG